ncbi:thiol:disulfide interchange protein TlpA [Polycladidibacter hongkongensis]|uniref:thiol:disulfide interchange protein TlpA n=1 Tax=Polycladidibacter hongkongensis TaxID=1647556 RepID=UPI0008337C45|nr:TlpA disulfide reductase family protein [Pseudovibrio hongkongensis]
MLNTSSSGNSKRRKGFIAGFGVIGALAASVFLLNWQGSLNSAPSCTASHNAAEAIKPLATGEVAALLPAQQNLNMADLSFKTAEGKSATPEALMGKTTLLNLWATWCAPCRKEMPDLDKLQHKLGGDAFHVLAVNVDRGDPQEKPAAFLKEIDVKHLALYNDNTMQVFRDLRAKARARGLPATVLIGKDGCEIGTMYGPANWAAPEALALIKAAIKAQE